MSFTNSPYAHASMAAELVSISDGDLTFTADKWPYAQASITVPLPPETILDAIRPGIRCGLSASSTRTWTGTQWLRTMNLFCDLNVVSREISHERQELDIRLASDESLLDAYKPITDDATPRQHETSLRSLVNYVLAKVIPGASLAPGPDADVTAYWPLTNLMVNPSVVGSSLGYQAGPNTSTATYSTAYGYVGTSSMSWVSSAAATALLHCRSFSVEPGRTYVMSAYATTAVDRRVRMMARFRDDDGNVIMDKYGPITTARGLGIWDRVTYIVTVPKGASNLSFNIGLVANSAGQTTYADAFQFYEGTEVVPYFDGFTASTGYVTQWQDASNASASERTPLVERLPELFIWRAGQTAWEFLEPLVTAAGLRLYCNHQRRWSLVDPSTTIAPGRFSATPANTVEGLDMMDARDDNTNITGVTATFRWIDARGEERTRTDTAGTPGKVKTLEFERPYTPGIAAQHLRKLQGQSRLQTVTVGVNYNTVPGQEIQIDLPGTEAQIGLISSVKYELTTGLMTIESGGLREYPAGAIAFLTGTIDALTGTIDAL